MNPFDLLRGKTRRRRESVIERAGARGVVQFGVFDWIVLNADGSPTRTRDGRPAWIRTPNAATTEGLNYILDVGFNDGTKSASWFFLIISATGYSALSSADTLASHGGWTENTSYSGNRKAWTLGTIASGSLPTGTPATFAFTSDTSIRGLGVCDVNTGSSGKLWATAVEGSSRAVVNGQSIQVYYTNTFSPVS